MLKIGISVGCNNLTLGNFQLGYGKTIKNCTPVEIIHCQ